MTWVGSDAGILVYTHFVGEGSDIRITIHNESGKRLDRIEGKVYANRFRETWTVPDGGKDAVYFEAELRDHGLKEQSEEMAVWPPVKITNLKWSQQEVRRGDIVGLTADVDEVPDGTEALIEIYEHDTGGAHDLVTKFPVLVEDNKVEAEWAFEYPGDINEIPTFEESENGYQPPLYFFRVKIGKASPDSDLLEFKDWIEITLEDEDEESTANLEYVIYLADGSERKGALDEEGYAREEDVSPGRAKVEFPKLKDMTELETEE